MVMARVSHDGRLTAISTLSFELQSRVERREENLAC